MKTTIKAATIGSQTFAFHTFADMGDIDKSRLQDWVFDHTPPDGDTCAAAAERALQMNRDALVEDDSEEYQRQRIVFDYGQTQERRYKPQSADAASYRRTLAFVLEHARTITAPDGDEIEVTKGSLSSVPPRVLAAFVASIDVTRTITQAEMQTLLRANAPPPASGTGTAEAETVSPEPAATEKSTAPATRPGRRK